MNLVLYAQDCWLQRVQQSLVVAKCSSEATQRLSPSTNSDLAQSFSSSSFSSFLAEAGKILNVYLASFQEQKVLTTLEYSIKEEHTQAGLPSTSEEKRKCKPQIPVLGFIPKSAFWGGVLHSAQPWRKNKEPQCLPFGPIYPLRRVAGPPTTDYGALTGATCSGVGAGICLTSHFSSWVQRERVPARD